MPWSSDVMAYMKGFNSIIIHRQATSWLTRKGVDFANFGDSGGLNSKGLGNMHAAVRPPRSTGGPRAAFDVHVDVTFEASALG